MNRKIFFLLKDQFLTTKYQKLTLSFLLCINISLYAQEKEKLTLGLTGVTLKEDITSLLSLKNYLEKKTNFEINFKFTKSYAYMKNLILNNSVDFAYICGSTYVDLQPSYKVKLLVLPVADGKTTYKSLIITTKEKNYKNIFDLKDKIFALSDPESNSASLVPQYMIYKGGYDYYNFFKRIIYTYDHGESIDAVISGYVDAASVDSVVYNAFIHKNPVKASLLKIIDRFGDYPIPPFVIRTSLSEKIVNILSSAFVNMNKDKTGRKILDSMAIDKFVLPHDISYAKIKVIKKYLNKIELNHDK